MASEEQAHYMKTVRNLFETTKERARFFSFKAKKPEEPGEESSDDDEENFNVATIIYD